MKMTISQIARLAGVGVETIRFYERRGLIDEPARPTIGYRQYPPDMVKRILFIRRAKELGFSLKEISELLTLSVEPTSTCSDVKKRAEMKIGEIECKIMDLSRMKRALVQVAERCRGDGSPRESCPILDTLGRDS
jgi:MerR family copper efflux transcriptional regulator